MTIDIPEPNEPPSGLSSRIVFACTATAPRKMPTHKSFEIAGRAVAKAGLRRLPRPLRATHGDDSLSVRVEACQPSSRFVDR